MTPCHPPSRDNNDLVTPVRESRQVGIVGIEDVAKLLFCKIWIAVEIHCRELPRRIPEDHEPVEALPAAAKLYYLGGQLYFRKGDVMVTVNTSKPLLSRQTTVSIAQRVASRM
jgi:hypothetical protein